MSLWGSRKPRFRGLVGFNLRGQGGRTICAARAGIRLEDVCLTICPRLSATFCKKPYGAAAGRLLDARGRTTFTVLAMNDAPASAIVGGRALRWGRFTRFGVASVARVASLLKKKHAEGEIGLRIIPIPQTFNNLSASRNR
jgi:hypothetical protein